MLMIGPLQIRHRQQSGKSSIHKKDNCKKAKKKCFFQKTLKEQVTCSSQTLRKQKTVSTVLQSQEALNQIFY